MRLSARVDYALRAAICLADAGQAWTRAERISAGQNIPLKFLESILLQLRHGGLAESRRGPDGGHRLLKNPAQVSLADVIRIVDGPLVGVRGQRPEHVDYSGPAEALSQVWVALRVNERNILEEVKLADVAQGKLPESITRLLADPEAWTSRSPH
ncbi:RrF2 family transcriptional regulator [Natronoglycomyces albus]|uniref:Rrf2 family transcriptional regulator n=1 Tax=Natronoglycomyces albus TaxID=2811108 RepID=A0A895XMJ3_9ACTN|nr:Rrf2 family transcriptional regulator [Natronoglycomyces albus]QSB04982.1 Rrf2 family transcriptional regulator [Natronoglycomyces albus]